jgi:hypothetical protein
LTSFATAMVSRGFPTHTFIILIPSIISLESFHRFGGLPKLFSLG